MAVFLTLSCSDEKTVIAVSKIEIHSEDISVRPGATLQLTAVLLPDDATGFDHPVWNSSDESVAAVDQSGLVTGVSEGEATITVSTGYAKASFALRVGPDIYVAGEHGAVNTLWKNGRRVWNDGCAGVTGKIVVTEDCIYIPVFVPEPDGPGSYAWLYADGKGTRLSEHFSEAYAVAVSGDDVYVAGFECKTETYDMNENRPVLWHNGNPTYLAESGYANDVAIENSDIYVCGYVTRGWEGQDATVWKNGTAQKLSDGSISNATGIAVRGEDVYVCGSDVDKETWSTYAVIWKNGIPERYEANAVVTDICVSPAGDLYACGYVVDYTDYGVTAHASMWKNGERTDLDSEGLEANATGICFSGGKVYVAGISCQVSGVSAMRAILWIDGRLIALEDAPRTSARAYSVAVIE